MVEQVETRKNKVVFCKDLYHFTKEKELGHSKLRQNPWPLEKFSNRRGVQIYFMSNSDGWWQSHYNQF